MNAPSGCHFVPDVTCDNIRGKNLPFAIEGEKNFNTLRNLGQNVQSFPNLKSPLFPAPNA
jgi:hypothetical protein